MKDNNAKIDVNKTAVPTSTEASDVKLSLTIGANFYNPSSSAKDFERFVERLRGLRFTPGKVLEPFSFEYELATLDELKYVGSLAVNPEGFSALGLKCTLVNGRLLRIEGTGPNKTPGKSFDGTVEIKLQARIHSKLSTKSLLKIDVPGFQHRLFEIKFNFPTISIPPKDLFIAPDPKTLWKDIPTDEGIEFYKPDTDSAYASIASDPSLVAIAASQRGRSHANEGKPRDDHFLLDAGKEPSDWHIFAVADGAGSAKYSREGSRIACETAVAYLRGKFTEYGETLDKAVSDALDGAADWRTEPSCGETAIKASHMHEFFNRAVYEAVEAIAKSAKEKNASRDDYSTTFLCAALKRLPATETRPAVWAIASYWVGDGGAAIYRPNGRAYVLTLGTPDGGEFAGQTRFITTSGETEAGKVFSRVRLIFVEDFQALALFTDGVTDPFFSSEERFDSYEEWKAFWEQILPEEFPGALDSSKTPEERAQALLNGMGYFRKGHHDDRTALLVVSDRCQLDDSPVVEKSESKETPDPLEEDSIPLADAETEEGTPDAAEIESASEAQESDLLESDAAETESASEARESDLLESDAAEEQVEPLDEGSIDMSGGSEEEKTQAPSDENVAAPPSEIVLPADDSPGESPASDLINSHENDAPSNDEANPPA